MEQAKRDADQYEPLYQAAYVRFAVATEIESQTTACWHNWGLSLRSHAERVSNADSPRLAMEAAIKFERVTHITPGDAEPFDNRALALMAVVEYAPGAPGADRWLADAHDALTVAISLSPDTASYWHNRAIVLIKQARRSPMDKRDTLLAEADAQSAIAYRLKPEYYGGLLNWGSVCAERARFAEDAAVAISHAREAEAKYEAAAKIEPNAAIIWMNWGTTCDSWARDEPERRAELFAEANEKFLVAERLDAENAHLLRSWAHTLVGLSRLETGENAERLLAQAEDKARHALRLQSGAPESHTTLCDVLTRRASNETDHDARDARFTEATAHANAANALRSGVAAYNRAVIAALTGDEADCETHLHEAIAGNHVRSRRRVRADEDLDAVRNTVWFRELFGQ